MFSPDLSKVKLTSEKWQEIFPEPHVLDPDGWDRKNFDHSWKAEEITQQEYEERVLHSTCDFKPRK